MVSSIISTTNTTYSITGSLHSLLGLLVVYHLPQLILLGILQLLQVGLVHLPHQVVAQVVHQTHYSTHYLSEVETNHYHTLEW